MTDVKDDLLHSHVAIAANTANILEILRPLLVADLGRVATDAQAELDTESLDMLKETAERLQNEAQFILDAINTHSAEPLLVAKDGLTDEEIDEEAEGQAEELVEDDVINRINGSLNEIAALRLAVGYLKDNPGRQNIRKLLFAAFGVSRLSRKEENRFMQLLDEGTETGLLRKYAKTYEYSPMSADELESVRRSEVIESASREISEEQIGLLEFIKANAVNGRINIAQIINEYMGMNHKARLPEPELKALIRNLNDLAAKGYLEHPDGPVYALPRSEPEIKIKRKLDPIVTPALNAPAPKAAPKQGEPKEETAKKAQRARKREVKSNETDEVVTELTRLETSILNYSKRRGAYRIEEMRRELPVIKNMSKAAYEEFKKNFPLIRGRIIKYLAYNNMKAYWLPSPKQRRGYTYELAIEKPTKAAKKAAGKHAVNTPIEQPIRRRRGGAHDYADVLRPVVYTPAQQRKFAGQLYNFIDGLITESPTRTINGNVARRIIAREINVSTAQADSALDNLVLSGYKLFKARTRGSLAWTNEAPLSTARNRASSTRERRPKPWTDIHTQALEDILNDIANIYSGNLQRGIDISKVKSLSKGGTKRPSDAVYNLVARTASEAGVFALTVVNRTSRSPRSKKMSKMVAIASGEQWAEIKRDKAAIIQRVKDFHTRKVTQA